MDEQTSQSSVFKVLVVDIQLQEPKVLDAGPEHLQILRAALPGFFAFFSSGFLASFQAALLVFFDFFACLGVVRSNVVIQESDDE